MWEKIVEKAIDIEAKASLQALSETKEINSRCLKGYRPLAKKKKTKPVKSIEIEIKTRLSPIIPCLLTRVSLKPRLSKKTSIIKTAKEAI